MTIAKNTGFMVASSVISITVTIITVPAYLNLVGQERYGVLALVWSVLLFFSLVELGGGALVRYIASSGKNTRERADYFLAALVLNLSVGIAIAFFVWGFFKPGVDLMKFSTPGLKDELLSASLIVVAFFPIMAIRSAFNGTLVGTERFLSLAILNQIDAVLSAFVPLGIALVFSLHLYWLLASVLVTRLALLMLAFFIARSSLPGLQGARLRKSCIQDLAGFASWGALTSILGSVLSLSDRFAVSNFVGVSHVPYLSVPRSLSQRIGVIPRAFGSVLFPRFSSLNNQYEKDRLANRALGAIATVISPIVILLILSIEVVFTIWISADFAVNASVPAQLLFGVFWLSAISRIPRSVIYGAGQPRLVAFSLLIELLPFVVLLYLLANEWGVSGAAFAALLRSIMDYALLGHFSKLSRPMSRHLLAFLPLYAAGLLICNLLPMDSVLRWIGASAILAIAAVQSILYMPPELVRIISRFPVVSHFPLGIWASASREPQPRHAK